MVDVPWFRAPADGDPGTLNACYVALDLPVIRGRADEVALVLDGTDHTFARLLTEVAACAGVLRAFGVEVGDEVALGPLPAETAVVAALAVARVGAVASYDESPSPSAKVRLTATDAGVVLVAGGDEVAWDVAMRAGRTDPAGCADVPGDAVLARRGDQVLPVLAALGSSVEGTSPVPEGLTLVEVVGVAVWTSQAPRPTA
jgi:acyl-coenzyme A synthetase/AMP-(fatty) acid ligase